MRYEQLKQVYKNQPTDGKINRLKTPYFSNCLLPIGQKSSLQKGYSKIKKNLLFCPFYSKFNLKINFMKIKLKAMVLAGILFCMETSALAQSLFLKMNNVTVESAISKFQKESGYSFVYVTGDIDTNKKVSVHAQQLKEAVEQILKGQPVSFDIHDKKVIIKKKVVDQLKSKKKQIRGVIKDNIGLPIIGASVMIKGTTIGTVTDVDGNYVLDDVPEDALLNISYIGYKTLAFKASDQKLKNVTMQEDTETLDEVVVVGYGVQKKANLTGAVSSIKMDEALSNRPVTTVSNVLMGTMPGLMITGTSGQPGGEMEFNIRGVNSINGGDPLVLVDNVEMDLNFLDPNDIESVSVLKDAASAAIYGARAAFGVILVTTKKGAKESHFSVNYSNNFSFSKAANLPHKASPLQTVQAYKDAGIISYQTGQDVDIWLDLLKEYNQNPSAYPKGYAMVNGLRYSLQETDLFDDMMETGFQQSHNVAITGGSKTIAYRMSAGIVDHNGILASNKDTYKRYNISSYIRSDLYSWLTPELDVKYTKSEFDMPYTTAPYGIWGAAVAFPSYFPLGNMDLDGESIPVNTPRNFIELAAPKSNQYNNLRFLGKMTLFPVKNLKIITEYTFNKKTRDITTFDKKFNYAHGGNFNKEQSVYNSKYSVEHCVTDYSAINIFVNYDKSIGKNNFSVMAGFNQESSKYKTFKASRTDMINEELPSLSQAIGDYRNEDSVEEYNVRGLFYRLNYTYTGKYLLETNGRYDGSSKFPKDNRFGFFPSVSAGWRISEEPFMEWSKKFMSNLKLRGSFGNIGNQSIKPYEFVPGMDSPLANWVVDGSRMTTLTPPALVSNSFTWEKVSTLDFGFDMSLFNNRLSMVFDWYQRDTKGMLSPGMELPDVLGAKAPLQNSANLCSKGWELSVDWRDQIGNVQYYLSFNLYDSRTKITKYDNEVGLLGNKIYRTGMELGEIWGYVTDRLYTIDDFDANNKLKEGLPKVEGYNPNPGDIMYKDFDNNHIINDGKKTAYDSGDSRIIGNSTRRYQYGIRGGTSWKGISLSFVLQGVGKRDLWAMNELLYPFYDPWSTIFDSQLDYWTPERPNSFFPRLYEKSEGNTRANQMKQTRYLLNGAFLSVRNISLSYAFPKKCLLPYGIKNLSVFFSGENLFTFDHLPKGMDPERVVTDNLGARGFTYPYMRQYSFGINLIF